MDIEKEEIRYLGDVQRLSLKPNDTLVISILRTTTDAEIERVKVAFGKFFPRNTVLVLVDGMKIGTVA